MARTQTNIWKFLKRAVLWGGTACTVLFLVSMVAFQSNLNQHHLRYRLDSDSGQPREALQEETVEVLRQRIDVMEGDFGLSESSVYVGGDGLVHLRFTTRSELEEVLFWLLRPARVRLTLVHPGASGGSEHEYEDPPEGYQDYVYTRYLYRISRPGELRTEHEHYLLGKNPVLEVDQLRSAHFNKVGLHSRTELTFRFEPEDAEKFRDVTALNVGRRMAMLVDDRLFFPPREIGEPIDGDAIQIQGYFYNPPLRKLVKVLNAGSLPAPLVKFSHQIQAQ
ncbi:MAG: SecDF P1 head subdomain-containing protein [Planctomycetota bacterium]